MGALLMFRSLLPCYAILLIWTFKCGKTMCQLTVLLPTPLLPAHVVSALMVLLWLCSAEEWWCLLK